MITTLNNLALIAAEKLQFQILDLVTNHSIYNDDHRREWIEHIEETTMILLDGNHLIFDRMPIDIPEKAPLLIQNHKANTEADLDKILERAHNYLGQLDKGRYGPALYRLRVMKGKAQELLKWHTYLKEQVLV